MSEIYPYLPSPSVEPDESKIVKRFVLCANYDEFCQLEVQLNVLAADDPSFPPCRPYFVWNAYHLKTFRVGFDELFLYGRYIENPVYQWLKNSNLLSVYTDRHSLEGLNKQYTAGKQYLSNGQVNR